MILTRILRGVHHLNTHLIAHRDLKPVYVWVCVQLRVVYVNVVFFFSSRVKVTCNAYHCSVPPPLHAVRCLFVALFLIH